MPPGGIGLDFVLQSCFKEVSLDEEERMVREDGREERLAYRDKEDIV